MKNIPFNIAIALIITICIMLTPDLNAQKTGKTTDKSKSKIAVTPGQVYEITEIKMPLAKDQMTDFVFIDDNGSERTLREYTLDKYVFLNF